ncbi:MAG: DHA2 family efflux MFS transporter permease subunit, partial [Anaerolineae bacterium]
TFPTIQWVVLAFLLGMTTLMLSVGRLADMIGKKRIFTAGLALFTTASALCGLSPSVYALIAFRLLQSVGAAMVVALGIAIVTETWPPEERGMAIGVAGGTVSLGIVVGPTLGGLLITTLGWRAIFYVNVPLGAVAILMVLRYVPDLRPTRSGETFDYLGAFVIGGGLLALSLALTVGQNLGFGDVRILTLLSIALVAGIAFVRIEQRAEHPMLDFSLFHVPQFSLNLLTGLLTFMAISGVIFLVPFYLDLVLQLPIAQIGVLMAIVPVVLAALGPVAGSLSDRFGTRPVSVVGLGLLIIGYLASSTVTANTTPFGFVLRMLPVGMGMGVFQSPNNSAIMGSAPRSRLGVASGTLSMTRTLGQTTGVAVLGAVFASRLDHYAATHVDITTASATALVLALEDQFHLAAALIVFSLAVALATWRHERRRAAVTARVQVPS